MPKTKKALKPKLAAGSKRPQEMTPWEYFRAQRTFFVSLPHDSVLMVERQGISKKGAPQRWLPDTSWEGDWDYNIDKLRKILGYSVVPQPKSLRLLHLPIKSTQPVVEIQLDNKLRSLDMFGFCSAWAETLIPPPWLSDMNDWYSGLARSAGDDIRFSEFLHGWDHIDLTVQRSRELVLTYAKARGYQAVIDAGGDLYLIDPSVLRIVGTWPDGVNADSQADIVAMDPAGASDELLCWLGVSPRKTWPNKESVAAEMDALGKVVDTYEKIAVDLRRRDHSLRQDVELDWLMIQSVRKMYEIYRRACFAVGSKDAVSARMALERMPMPGPGVVGRERPADKEGWPDHLFDLSILSDSKYWGQFLDTHLGHIRRHIDGIANEAAKERSSSFYYSSSLYTDVEGTRHYISSLMRDAGWSRGADDIELTFKLIWTPAKRG